MSGASANLPSLEPASNSSANAQSGLGNFLQTAGALTSGGEDSPLHGVTTLIGELDGVLQIDISGLAEGLPQALTVIENALPADTLSFVEDIEISYREVNDFLSDNELVQQIGAGANLEDTALAIVDEVINMFGNRLSDLGSSLIDTDTLNQVQSALQTIDTLAAGGSIDAGDLLDFLADNLLGVDANLLSDADTHLNSALSFLQPLSATAVETALSSAHNDLTLALQNLANGVNDFDAADAAAYAAMETLVDTYAAALDTAFNTLETLYDTLDDVVSASQWSDLFSAYATVLDAIPVPDVPTVDDAIDELAGFMESLLSRLSMSLSPEELAEQITRVSSAIHDMFADSPLQQVRQIILDFISRIEQAIDAVPTQDVQSAVDGMLNRVGEEIDNLGIAQVRQGIEDGFQSANDFIDDNLGGDLLGGINEQLSGLLTQLDNIPIGELAETITGAITQAGQVVTDLQDSLSDGLDELKNLLSTLDSVDFTPVSNEVVDEIQALKTKLETIDPSALSDVEKLAIQAGLAVISAIDLQGEVVGGLKDGYAAISDPLAGVIQRVLDAWLEFRRRIGVLDASALAAPITGLLDELNNLIQRLNGEFVTSPLQELVDKLTEQLQTLSPADLLDPLQAPYDRMMATIERASPDVWVEPLRMLHGEIDRLVTLIDITPLLTRLEDKEKELFANTNQAITDALDSVSLPAPLDAFYEQIKTLVLGLSDAVFGDPDGTLRTFSSSISDSIKPSTLFEPLDAAFDRLLKVTRTLPNEQVLEALEALRQGLGVALPAMNPNHVVAQLREMEGRLAGIAPTQLAGTVKLPALRARLELSFAAHGEHVDLQASLLARFDIALTPLQFTENDARLRRLHDSHQQLLNSLRQQINALDASGAQLAYQRLNSGLRRLLPGFLMQTTPLQAQDIQSALASLRPTTKARRLDDTVDRFLAELQPLQASLDDAVNGFFTEIRQGALMLYPGDIKDAVADVYVTLREKLDILDPDELANDLRNNVWEPLLDPLQAINPSQLKTQLQALFDNLVSKITGTLDDLLAQVKQAIDAFLLQIREALSSIVGALGQEVEGILANVTELIAQLDGLIVDELFNRLLNLLSNLKTSFNLELDRVSNEFSAMLNAIPLGGSASGSVSA